MDDDMAEAYDYFPDTDNGSVYQDNEVVLDEVIVDVDGLVKSIEDEANIKEDYNNELIEEPLTDINDVQVDINEDVLRNLDFSNNRDKTEKFISRFRDKLTKNVLVPSSNLIGSLFNSKSRPSEENWNIIIDKLEHVGIIKKVGRRKGFLISLNN